MASERLVNGWVEPKENYVLAILGQSTSVTKGVAGLEPVQLQGAENFKLCESIEDISS